MRCCNAKLEYPLVHLLGLLQRADTLDEIDVETPQLPALVHALLRCQRLVEVVHVGALRRLGGLGHDLDSLVEVLVSQLHLSPFDPHLSELGDRLEGHLDGLLHDGTSIV